MLDSALEGVKSAFPDEEVRTERINLIDLSYTGCRSCFACKRKDERFLKTCAIRDDLFPVLENLKEADGVIIGSPIYFHNITGILHCFYERLFFPYLVYKPGFKPLETNKMATACIYTMNVFEEGMIESGYRQTLERWESFLKHFFSEPRVAYAFNTFQFDRYDEYICEVFDEREKARHRDEQFPKDLQNAYELGRNLLK
jgi:multimeric flavodoxin WrbA